MERQAADRRAGVVEHVAALGVARERDVRVPEVDVLDAVGELRGERAEHAQHPPHRLPPAVGHAHDVVEAQGEQGVVRVVEDLLLARDPAAEAALEPVARRRGRG
ncbi:MAG: hypothetical protein R3F30_14150 [Planctomycetota bacterium]